jgi:glycyl-tRNA synthetase beta chain
LTDFLLELRSEEIPARMQVKAKDDLARHFAEEIAKAGLKAETTETFATPRRLALIARGLPDQTEGVSEERKGPRANAPEQALAGFLRSTGLTRDQLTERDGVLFAVIDKPGRSTADVLSEAIPAIIRAFPWPKSMRWGEASVSTESLRWVRPLQGIVALFGSDVVDCDVDGIESGRATMGHRFHHSGPVTITNADDYIEKLRAAHVIVHLSERKKLIEDGAAKAAAAAGLTVIPDEGLVLENAGLTEWPVPLLGRFDLAFLDVPREVIQLTMRTNQKYFACADSAGKLANAFVCTANIDASDGGAAVIAGNEKVLSARLSDAKFFWEQDLKVKLEDQAKKLSDIVFHEKLGTVADKVERVAKLAEWLATEKIVPDCDPVLARKAAELCKADLVTGMVGEFPELQGIMGGYYARAQGYPPEVADAIRDHYKPIGQGDDVPAAPVTVAVSLADKLDTICGFAAWQLWPTGSKDPFALRRAAIGVLQILMTNQLRMPFNSALMNGIGYSTYVGYGVEPADLLAFFADRLKVQQREAGVRHDLIDAVFALGGEDDLVRLLARVKALQGFVGTDEGRNLLSGYKRAANILKKEAFDPHGMPAFAGMTDVERGLLSALDAAEPRAAAAIAAEDFEAAMSALASLRKPIDAFFEGVMVNDPDPAVRAFRLGLLTRFRDAVHTVADFSKIEG